MILAYHTVLSAYGFWLPNAPRGSWSDFVASWELVRFGKATKTTTRRSLANIPHDRRLREEAKGALKYPPVHFSDEQILAVARGFDRARIEGGYAIHACSIMPEHVHLVMGRHERSIRRIAGHLKGRGTQQLSAEGLWCHADRPVWGEGSWPVYIDRLDDLQHAIEYVEANPEQEGRPRQKWSFVTPYPF